MGKEKRETKRKLTATQTKLEKALNRKVNLEDEKGRNADEFLEMLEMMLDTLLADEKGLRSNLETMMKGLMERIVTKDGKKKGTGKENTEKFKAEESKQMTDMMVEAMLNTSLDLNGKSKACRYSPDIFVVAQVVWSTSPSAYKELGSLMPFSIPSIRNLKRNKKEAHTNDGRNAKPY